MFRAGTGDLLPDAGTHAAEDDRVWMGGFGQGDPVAGAKFRCERSRQPLPRIDPWRDQLDGLLLANEGKPAGERPTLIGIFEELRGLGYEGSYDAARRDAKRWRAERRAAMAEAYVPLSFAPGEAYQFDGSHEVVLINGTTVTVKWRMSGCVTAGCCSCGPIRARARRWYSTAQSRLRFLQGRLHAASTTT